jgi:hypothetical protein
MCRNGWMKRMQRLMIPVASRGHGFHLVALGQCRITTCGVSSRCLCWPGHLVGGGPSVPVALSYAEELVKALPTDAAAHFEAARLYARAAHEATGERGMEWRGEALGFLRSARDLSAEVKGGGTGSDIRPPAEGPAVPTLMARGCADCCAQFSGGCRMEG